MEGRIFHIYTDHKPLTFTISSNADRSPRQTRHLSFVTEFITDVRHIPGKTNVVVDMLSRVRTPDEITSPSPLSSVSAVTQNDSINYNEMSRARVNDCGLQAYRSTATALVLRDIELENGVTVLCYVFTSTPRPPVPRSWQRRVFDAILGLSHPFCMAWHEQGHHCLG